MKTIGVINLGRTDYRQCWEFQQRLLDRRVAGDVDDLLLLTEHNHVYTIGKSGDDDHLLANEEELRSKGVAVYHNDRGGDITYHGPGQLVGYPILDLNNYYLDLHRYLRDIEEVIVRTLACYGVAATRDTDYTGVWVGADKICAIGVKTSRWVTMHGFALNINTDLTHFGRIIPCGIFEKGVTSLKRLLGHEVDVNEVGRLVAADFGNVFGREMKQLSVQELEASAIVEKV